MIKGWTRRLGRTKSSSSDKNRPNAHPPPEEAQNSVSPTTKKASADQTAKPEAPSTPTNGAPPTNSKSSDFGSFPNFGRNHSNSDQHMRPEAFDMSNTSVSSRRASGSSSNSRDSLAAAMPSKRRSSSNKDLASHAQGKSSSSKSSKSSSSASMPPELRISTKHATDGSISPRQGSPSSPFSFSPTTSSFVSGSLGVNAAIANSAGPELSSPTNASPSHLNGPTLPHSTSFTGNPTLGVGFSADASSEARSASRRNSLDRMDGLEVPQRHNSSRLEVSAERQLEQLPTFDDVPMREQLALFYAKIEQCNVMFNFSDPGSDARGKEIKRVALCELIDFASSADIFAGGEQVYEAVFSMFRRNIIRSIPPPKNPFGEIYDPDDDEPVNVDAWPHMSLVYEFFLRFIDAPDLNVATARQYIDQPFILSLLELFDSEDPRERDFLKTTLHRVYGKFLGTRPFIRRSINHVFLQFIYETGRFNGIAELLEIFGSIINGFAIPLKDEHKVFLSRVLLPLHTARSLGLYHSHLTYCVVQFLEKDPTLTQEVVMGLLRFWPKVSSPKEVLFLLELEDIFEAMEPEEFTKVQVPVFQQLARCISSPHGQVAERALCNWTHEYFSTMVAENSDVILPILFPAMCENSGHWNRTIHSMVHSATKMFLEANPMLYERCAAEYREKKLTEKESQAQRQHSWEEVERMAKKRLQEKQQTKPPARPDLEAPSLLSTQTVSAPLSEADHPIALQPTQPLRKNYDTNGSFSAIMPALNEDAVVNNSTAQFSNSSTNLTPVASSVVSSVPPLRTSPSPASQPMNTPPTNSQTSPPQPSTASSTAPPTTTPATATVSSAKRGPVISNPSSSVPSAAVAMAATTTQKRPTSSAPPSSIPGLQYNKKSSSGTSGSRPTSGIAGTTGSSRSAPISSTTKLDVGTPPYQTTSVLSATTPPSPSASPAAVTRSESPISSHPSASKISVKASESRGEESDDEDGFLDAPGFEEPPHLDSAASPFLMSCPSSPES